MHIQSIARRALTYVLPLLASAAMAQADNALLLASGPERASQLVAAAKAEGAVTLYTSIAGRDLKPLLKPFEEKYGIKVTVWRASGDSVMNRVINESKASRAGADIVHAGVVELEVLRREKLLQPVNSPYFVDLLQGSVAPGKEWAATIYSMWVQAYNTNLVKKEDLPQSYQDLLDPRWKNKLGYEVENIDWFAAVVKSMGEAKGVQFFRDLSKGNGISVRKGHSNLNGMVAAGDVPMALTVYNYMPEQLKGKGAPIDWTVLQPAVVRANAVGVVKGAKNAAAAALLEDYLLSDAQPIYAKLSYLPASKKIKSALDSYKIMVVDPSESLDGRDHWKNLYDEIIIKGSK